MTIPDVTALAIAWTETITGLAADQVAADIPDEIPDEFVHVRRMGGPARPPARDQPLMHFGSWHDDAQQAMTRLEVIRAALWALPGDSTAFGVTVYQVADSAGPTSTNDPNTGRPFAFMRVSLTIRADDLIHQFS